MFMAIWTGFVLNWKYVHQGKQMILCLLKVDISVTKLCMTTDTVIIIQKYQSRKIMVVIRWQKQNI